ncbi:AMP-binding protein [Variovorax sp. J31P207]|uniref:AMP-binding protein n=1 Tax=Variovorax sp. J31P207 TaxID=3053510 RepID=UPI0025788980|nr:AMP-binding protein [Variovorax sp. J31P207]MDM0069947.1 AMP-binding protein [Variovorax sp. J31P207]
MTTMPTSRTIPALLDEQAVRYGEREAFVAGSIRLTYRRLREEVRRTAKGLKALGVKRGDHVAILMGNRIEWVLSFFALQQLGAISVGLNTWSTPREMEYALSHSEVSCLIAVDWFRRNNYRAMINGMQPRSGALSKLQRMIWISAGTQPTIAASDEGDLDWEAMMALGEGVSDFLIDETAGEIGADDVAMLLYTSGSTAAPKGMLLQHANWIQNAFNIGERQHSSEADRLWLAVSLFWSFGSVNAMPNVMTHGGCVILQEHFDAPEALSLIERERCTLMYGTPNMVQALIEHPDRARRDLSSLRSGAMIGTPEQLMGAVELGARKICNVYGLSETYGNCAVTDANDTLEVRLHSVGRPLDGVVAKISHVESGATLCPGEVGEIRVQGPLFAAYFKDAQKTREAFDEDGYFRTGDLGSMDGEGRLYYRGRLKEMVKSGGINIAPIEVEETLLGHAGVQSAYVIGVPDPSLDEILVAFIVPAADCSVTAEELKQFCKKELAAYKVPSQFRFITDAELPLTSTGKLQKMRLVELLKSGETA